MAKSTHIDDLEYTLKKLNINKNDLNENQYNRLIRVSEFLNNHYMELNKNIDNINSFEFSIVYVSKVLNISRATIYRDDYLLKYLDYSLRIFQSKINSQLEKFNKEFENIKILEKKLIEKDLLINQLNNSINEQKKIIKSLKDINKQKNLSHS